MIVSSAISMLQKTELKQVALKDDVPGIINAINFGILEIHKRFNLWQDEAIITMVEGKRIYKLDGTDADVDINLSDHDILLIVDAYDTDGNPVEINDEQDTDSILTPQYHRVEVAESDPGKVISIIYRASPKFLTKETDSISLPPQFLEALFHYVGYRGHGAVKTDIKGENNTHYARFVASCALVKAEGLFAQDDLETHSKFDDRGFV